MPERRSKLTVDCRLLDAHGEGPEEVESRVVDTYWTHYRLEFPTAVRQWYVRHFPIDIRSQLILTEIVMLLVGFVWGLGKGSGIVRRHCSHLRSLADLKVAVGVILGESAVYA